MTQFVVLVMVLVVVSAKGEPIDMSGAPVWGRVVVEALSEHPWAPLAAGLMFLTAAQAFFVAFCVHRLGRTGRSAWIRRADRALLMAQWGSALWLGVCCHLLGWCDQVRAWLGGDWVIVDEVIALAPGVLALTLQWGFFYPVERRVRDATFFKRLDSGEPVRAGASLIEYVTDQLRTHAGPLLVASMLLFAWVESVDLLAGRAHTRWSEHPGWVDGVASGALVVGVIAIVGVLPLTWRVLWRTRRLPPGALRDELQELCARHRVRVADLLVWHTRGGVLNGALVGVLPRLRYIMLTDALLERLNAREVEAVMAHEIAHAHHRHIPWLIASLAVVVGLSGALGSLVMERLVHMDEDASFFVGGAFALVLAVLTLGWVSRCFEEQADAFAAKHLALVRTDGDIKAVIGEADAAGMIEALLGVATHNHIDARKFSFRHGSIRTRCERLARLVGQRVDALPVDRLVKRTKRAVVVGGVALAIVLWRFPEAGALL